MSNFLWDLIFYKVHTHLGIIYNSYPFVLTFLIEAV